MGAAHHRARSNPIHGPPRSFYSGEIPSFSFLRGHQAARIELPDAPVSEKTGSKLTICPFTLHCSRKCSRVTPCCPIASALVPRAFVCRSKMCIRPQITTTTVPHLPWFSIRTAVGSPHSCYHHRHLVFRLLPAPPKYLVPVGPPQSIGMLLLTIALPPPQPGASRMMS